MSQVVVPVRYPLSEHSRRTLDKAVDIAAQREAALTVLHVDLYQDGHSVTRGDLKDAVEETVGPLDNTRYSVREGLLVEETILDEVAAENADVVVIGNKQVSRWREMIRRLVDDPNVEGYLRAELDAEVVTASPD